MRPGGYSSPSAVPAAPPEPTDWYDRVERAFLGALVEELRWAAADGKLKGPAIVAPPRALGVIREATPLPLRALVKAEVGHDYTHLPVQEVERLSG
jgi:protein required for attachment to host cells